VLIDNRGGQAACSARRRGEGAPDGIHHRVSKRGRAYHQPEYGKSRLRYRKIFSRSRWWRRCRKMLWSRPMFRKDMSELIASQGAARKTQFASAVPAACRSGGRTAQADGKNRHRARPYRGAAPAVNDLLGQQVQMVFSICRCCCRKSRPAAKGNRDRRAGGVPTQWRCRHHEAHAGSFDRELVRHGRARRTPAPSAPP